MGILLNKSKNYIINGAMDYWQRNTSFAAIATTTYFADRFQYLKSGTMVHTVSRSTDVPTSSASTYSALLDVTTAQASIGAAEFNFISHKIEGTFFSNLKSKTQTLRFKVKATKTGIYCVAFRNAAQDRTLVKEYSISASNTWETKTITFTHDASGTWLYDTGIGIQVIWTIAAGTSLRTTADTWQNGGFIATANQVNGVDNLANDFRITEVQLEEGQSASNFERASINVLNELQLCMRYYEKSYELATNPGTNTNVGCCGGSQATNVPELVFFKVSKRITPSVIPYSIVGTANSMSGSIAGGSDLSVINIVPSDKSIMFNGSTWTRVFQWTADAEL